jgi:6-phosphogluconolactonase (cycloisomerase 2 family)
MGTFIFKGGAGSARQSAGSVAAFRLNPDGSQVPVPGSPFRTNHRPRVLRSDPQGRFLFIGESDLRSGESGGNCAGQPVSLTVDRIDPASGTLTQIGSVALRGSCLCDIAVDPSGTHLYLGVENLSTSGGAIQEFLIGSKGTLTELAGSPVMVEDVPVSFAMHPSGRFLYAATPDLTILDRDPRTGELSVRAVFSTPKRQLALNPAGTLLAARERDTNEVSEFQLDAGGNVIGERQVQTLPPFALAVDPLVVVVQLR